MMKTNFASRNLSWAAIRHGDELSVFRVPASPITQL